MCSCSTHHCTAHQSIPGETTLGGESLSVVTPGSISTPEPSIGENQNKDENTDKNFTLHNNVSDVVSTDAPTMHDHPARGSPRLTRDQGEGDQHTHPPIPGEVVSASVQQRTCRGICSIHGPGAKRFWRLKTERLTSPNMGRYCSAWAKAEH